LAEAWPDERLMPQLPVPGVKAGDADRTVDRALVDTECNPVVLVEVKALTETNLSPYGPESTNYCELAKSRYGQKPRWAWLTNGREWWLFDSHQPHGKDPLLRLSPAEADDRATLAKLLLAQGASPAPDDDAVLRIVTEARLHILLPELRKKPPEPLLGALRHVLQERLPTVPDDALVNVAWQQLTQTTKLPSPPPSPDAHVWVAGTSIPKEVTGSRPVRVWIGDCLIESDRWWKLTVAVARHILKQTGSLPQGSFRPRGKKTVSVASTPEGMQTPEEVAPGWWIEIGLGAPDHCRQAAWLVQQALPGTPLRVEYVPKAGVVVEKRGRANDPGTPLRVEYVPKGKDSP
jgi:hypothetical protein